MTKQQIIDDLRSENNALRRNIADLRIRHDRAIDALANLSSGMGRKRDDHNIWQDSMECLAREELAAIAKMPLREGP